MQAISYRNRGLDPKLADFLDETAKSRVDLSQVPVEELRAATASRMTVPEDQRVTIGPIWDDAIDDLPIRVYHPIGDGPFPTLIFFHGGGWVIGSIEQSDALCRRIVQVSDCAVISVEYRLAPEHPFPIPLEDCYKATAWVAEHASEVACDPLRIGVGGASAGGNLAAAVALMARDRKGPDLACQLLLYPNTTFEMDRSAFKQCLDQDLLYYDKMKWLWDQYLPQGVHTPNYNYASVLSEPILENLPAAMIVLAEHDPLRGEGKAYAARLEQAGNRVYEQLYSEMTHGFLEFPIPLAQVDLALENIGIGLHKLFNA